MKINEIRAVPRSGGGGAAMVLSGAARIVEVILTFGGRALDECEYTLSRSAMPRGAPGLSGREDFEHAYQQAHARAFWRGL